MDSLPDELLQVVIGHLTDDLLHIDLLHIGRVCKRFNQVVRTSDGAWEGLFKRTFPEQPIARAAVKGRQGVQPRTAHKQQGVPSLQTQQSLEVAVVHSTNKQPAGFSSLPQVQQLSSHKPKQQQQQQQQGRGSAHRTARGEAQHTWYQKFKERYMAEATTKRLERRVALLKARSAVAHLTRTITEVKAGIGQEQRKLQGYEAEASRLTHMMRVAAVAPPESRASAAPGAQGRQGAQAHAQGHAAGKAAAAAAAAAGPVWVPGAVQEAWARILTSQAAVDPQTRLNQIHGDSAAARVQLKVLRAQLEARQAELEAAKRRVRSLETT